MTATAKPSLPPSFLLLLLLLLASLALLITAGSSQLITGFYNDKCPEAESLILKEMKLILKRKPRLAGSFLRLHFHDCFVRGCDGSILLNSRKGKGEKDALSSSALVGFTEIERIKQKLERICPLTVSCADIIAIAARDSVFLTNGPAYEVETGRRDGDVSTEEDAKNDVPPPSTNVTDLQTYFSQKGLTTHDLVVLTGAHTIGLAHCISFTQRLYNYTGHRTGLDPAINKDYAAELMSKCPRMDDNETMVQMDPGSPMTFDLSFYRLVAGGRGMFASDATLLDNRITREYVMRQANATSTEEFFRDFAQAVIRMGRVGVITGNSGVVRDVCAAWVD